MTNIIVAEKKAMMAQAKARHSNPAGVQTHVVKKRKNREGNMVNVVPILKQPIIGTFKSPTSKKNKREAGKPLL